MSICLSRQRTSLKILEARTLPKNEKLMTHAQKNHNNIFIRLYRSTNSTMKRGICISKTKKRICRKVWQRSKVIIILFASILAGTSIIMNSMNNLNGTLVEGGPGNLSPLNTAEQRQAIQYDRGGEFAKDSGNNGRVRLTLDQERSGFSLKSSPTNVAIFYDVYPAESKLSLSDPGQAQQLFGVAEAQIEQIVRSSLTSSKFNTTVFYVTIGRPEVINATTLTNFCNDRNRLHCQHLRHHQNYVEGRTLLPVYKYCQSHLEHKVIYIHTRGKYTIT